MTPDTKNEPPKINNKNNVDNVSETLQRKLLFSPTYFFCTYIPLDNTYVILEMITTIIILIFGGLAFLMVYKSSITDPIADIKNAVINSHLIIILIMIIANICVNIFSKTKDALIKKLVAILVWAVLIIFVFLGIKINLNSTYTNNKFEQIYVETYGNENADRKNKLDFTTLTIKTEKEYFIDECVKMYTIFNIKTSIAIVLNGIFVLLLIYQISKISKIQERRDRLDKDDAILYDEEENIKI